MLDELKARSLTEAARQLGTDPFELVRLRVVAGASLDRLSMTAAEIEQLRQTTGKR